MDDKTEKLVDSLNLPDEKRKWIETYIENHIEAEANPQPEQEIQIKAREKRTIKEDSGIHSVIADLWNNRIVS